MCDTLNRGIYSQICIQMDSILLDESNFLSYALKYIRTHRRVVEHH